jgi:hypothetical protein
LGLERAVVNAGGMPCTFKCGIGQVGPDFTPARDLGGAGRAVVQFAGFVTEAVRPEAARGAKNVRMVVALVAFFAGCVNGYVHGASVVLD